MVTLMVSQPTSTTVPAQGAADDAQHSPRRWWALIAIAASVLVVGLDLTVLNLALPNIAVSLHASTGDLQWFSDAYSLVIAAMILPAGLLGDRYGRKRVLLVALVLFGAASALCAFATSTGELIGARALLGVGASAIFPMSLSVLPTLFAPEERRKAIAIMSAATMLSFPIGPILGGYLLDHFWWGSVFLINVPVVVIALVAVVFLLPESRSANRPSIDVLGVLVSSAGLIAVTYGCIKAGQNGWGNATALATIAVGLVLLALFVLVERRITARGGQSLVDLALFQSVGFRWGTILVTFLSFTMFGLFFALPQYFQNVRGADSLGSGLRLLPMVARHGRRDGHRDPAAVGPGRDRRGAGQIGGRPAGRDHGRVRGHRGRAGDRRVHHADQLDLVHAGLGRGLGAGLRPGDAGGDERHPRLADGGAQRVGLRPDLGHAAGRLGDRGRHPRHADQQRLRQPGGHHRAPGRGGRPGADGRGGRRRGGARSSARPRCSTRCAPRSSTAWTSCCGRAAVSRSAARCSR